MALLNGRRLYVAFDAGAVSVAAFQRGPGRPRLGGFRRVALEPGALVPSSAGPNLVRREEVREALARGLDELQPAGRRATLVLPDGIARIALVEPPAEAEPRDYVRFRLAPSLPWPASEAAIDLLPVGRKRVVGAAVRRATVARYEQLSVAAGLSVDRVHLAPLMALEALVGRGGQDGVHIILGDAALCLALVRSGELLAIRNRRRDVSDGEADRLRTEATRIARLAGDGDAPARVVLSGSGARDLRVSMEASAPSTSVDLSEGNPELMAVAWLAGAIG